MSSSTSSTTSLPIIEGNHSFVHVVKTLSNWFLDEIPVPVSFERLKMPSGGYRIPELVDHLVANCKHPALVNALLTLKWHFSLLGVGDHHGIHGIHTTRANACEIVAWRFLSRISEREAVEFCLYTLPRVPLTDIEAANSQQNSENAPILPQFRSQHNSIPKPISRRANVLLTEVLKDRDREPEPQPKSLDEEEPTSEFSGLNGLEIAAAAGCENFLSQSVVHKIVTGIWNGDIAFWDSLTPDAKKKPHFYIKGHHEHFLRLRVPKYIKAFEVIFFATFLLLYYVVLEERNPYEVTPVEYILYVWFAAFAYDELGEYLDAGGVLYSVNAWNIIDLVIILLGITFTILRMLGLRNNNHRLTDIAFNILSLETLFMVPRVASLLSLHPYFGTLLPCLKEMTYDFFKFMGVVGVIYFGFLSTFVLLARDTFTFREMTWFLTEIFLGSNALAWSIMRDINHYLGPPLMIIFVIMTRILLLPAIMTILHSTFTKAMSASRLKYLFVYSVFTLEVSTRNRLTHFYPPFNLVPLILVRPLRLIVPAEKLRVWRIIVLKATHLPIVGLIIIWDTMRDTVRGAEAVFSEIDLSSAEALHISRKTNKAKPFLAQQAAAKGAAHNLIEMPTDNCHLAVPIVHDKKGKTSRSGNRSGSDAEGGEKGNEEMLQDLGDKIQGLGEKVNLLAELVVQVLQFQRGIVEGETGVVEPPGAGPVAWLGKAPGCDK